MEILRKNLSTNSPIIKLIKIHPCINVLNYLINNIIKILFYYFIAKKKLKINRD